MADIDTVADDVAVFDTLYLFEAILTRYSATVLQ